MRVEGKLVVELVRYAITTPTNRNNPFSQETKCLATLRYLDTGKMLCNADDLGISQPSVSRAINQTINVLSLSYGQSATTQDQSQLYGNQKKVHSINTQVVFEANFNILDVVAKWPGSTQRTKKLSGNKKILFIYR